jgi:hypothetical protein
MMRTIHKKPGDTVLRINENWRRLDSVETFSPNNIREWISWGAFVVLAGYALFCHGCHGNEDNELFAQGWGPSFSLIEDQEKTIWRRAGEICSSRTHFTDWSHAN